MGRLVLIADTTSHVVDIAHLAFTRILEASLGYSQNVRVQLSDDAIEVRLARWEKVLGLMRDIRVRRADVGEVEVIANPLRAVMGTGLKVGLRVPWLYYVARSIRLDQAWLVRRGVPALSFAVSNHGALRRVIVSTGDAELLAARLAAERPRSAAA